MDGWSIRQILCASLALLPASTLAATAGFDNASRSAYVNGWPNNSGGNATFSNWSLDPTSSSSLSGFFIGDSRQLASGFGGADINSSGSRSFGLYGHRDSNNNTFTAKAARTITDSLSVGQSFSLTIAVNSRNGSKGVDVFAGSTQVFNLNVGDNDYSVNNSSFVPATNDHSYSANTSFQITFSQLTSTGGSFAVARAGGFSQTYNGTYTGGLLSKFDLYSGSTEASTSDNFYANNFEVSNTTPEVTTPILFGFAAATVTLARRRSASGSMSFNSQGDCRLGQCRRIWSNKARVWRLLALPLNEAA